MTFGCHRKIITFSCNVQNVQSVLENKAMELFDVDGPQVLWYMDQDFDEWVDMEEDCFPIHKEKLMLSQVMDMNILC